jgi:glycosyltransferase 2 family protein
VRSRRERPPAGAVPSRASRLSDAWGRSGPRQWGRHATEAAAGIGLLGLSWLILVDRTESVPRWEADVFKAFNDLPDGFRWPVWPIMQLGNFWMVVVSGLGVYAATRRVRPALAASTAVVAAWAAAKVVKKAAQRGRPADLLEHVNLREAGLHGKGYVSGHTAIAFAVATVVAPLLPPRWRPLPFVLASFVGLIRLYYGAHLPLGVVGGAGLGILCGLLSSIAFGTIDPVHDR